MTTSTVFVERRIGQRFAFNLPVSVRDVATGSEGLGFSQDLSSRGVFFFTGMGLSEGAEIELTLKMPSEITLGESMRVRCRGRVLRIVKRVDSKLKPIPDETDIEAARNRAANGKSHETTPDETKIGVAVCLNGYEYLSEADDGSAEFRRISALHTASETERPAAPQPAPRASVQ